MRIGHTAAHAALAALLIACLLAPATLTALPAPQADTIERSFSVQPGGELRIETNVGSIEVAASGGDRVEVAVHREVRRRYEDDAAEILAAFEVEMSQQGNDVVVRTEVDRDRWRRWRSTPLNVRFEVRVPSTYDVDLRTAGGHIEVSELTGEVRAHTAGGHLTFGNIDGQVVGNTSGGHITLRGASGPAELETSGGHITIGEVGGRVDAHTSGGSIRIERAGGEVRARTSGGHIEVEEVLGAITASTSGGNVRATITEQPQADCRLSTSGGTVTVELADGIGVDVDAEAGGGWVDSDVEITGTVRRSSLRGTINGGGPQLHLRSSGGSVRIRRR